MIASSRSGKGRLLFCRRAAPIGKLTLPQSTRSGQDRSLRTAAHGCLVGRGLDPSGQPGGGRRAVGAGHARPAALKRLPDKGWPRRPPGRACPAPTGKLALPQSTRSGQDRSLRTAAHGCLVGRGLDPSGQPPPTPKRGPLFGRSRFGWYRKIIRKWLVYPRITRSCGICGRRF